MHGVGTKPWPGSCWAACDCRCARPTPEDAQVEQEGLAAGEEEEEEEVGLPQLQGGNSRERLVRMPETFLREFTTKGKAGCRTLGPPSGTRIRQASTTVQYIAGQQLYRAPEGT